MHFLKILNDSTSIDTYFPTISNPIIDNNDYLFIFIRIYKINFAYSIDMPNVILSYLYILNIQIFYFSYNIMD